MVFLHVQDIDHKGEYIGATGKSHTCYNVETDPQAPGNFLRKIGNGSQSLGKSDNDQHQTQYDYRERDDVERS